MKVHPTTKATKTIASANAQQDQMKLTKMIVNEFAKDTASDESSDIEDITPENGDDDESSSSSRKKSTGQSKRNALVTLRTELKKKIIKEVLDEVLPDIGAYDVNGTVQAVAKSRRGMIINLLKFFGLVKLDLYETILTGNFDKLEKFIVDINVGKTPNPMLINQIDDKGRIPLIMCVKIMKPSFVRLMLHYNAQPDMVEESTGRTALHYATMIKSVEIVKYLLEKRASVHIVDYEAISPLMLAARNNDDEITELYCNELAEVDGQDINGWTPLHYAVSGNATTTIRILLHWGAHRDIRDKNKRKPIHLARFLGHGECVSILEDLKARIAASELEDI